MSPEIKESKQPFDGHAVDLWALGPLLFIFVMGFPPWENASLDDEKFRCFSNGGLEQTLDGWYNARQININLSSDLKSLLQSMFFGDPKRRLCLEQIRAHPWMNGPMTPPSWDIEHG